VTDRGATLATIGGVSDNFFWTETDLQLRNVYTRLLGRHTLKAGGDLLRGQFTIISGPGARGPTSSTSRVAGSPQRVGS